MIVTLVSGKKAHAHVPRRSRSPGKGSPTIVYEDQDRDLEATAENQAGITPEEQVHNSTPRRIKIKILLGRVDISSDSNGS